MFAVTAFVCLLLFPTVLSSQIYYLVTIPAELHYPSMEKVCFQLFIRPTFWGDITLSITMERKGPTRILFHNNVMTGDPLKCVQVYVPAPAGGIEEVVTIKVSVDGPGISLTESKKALILQISNGIVVQTDKPVYKPSQTVRFRIVRLKENFVPVYEKYHIIELKDPNSNRLAQWLNVKPYRGIVDLSYQLSDEPPLGTYTISVENGMQYKTFDVMEYVLPKFEVDFLGPFVIYALAESFHLKVCGRYTYGKQVSGLMTVTACRNVYWVFGFSQDSICHTYFGQTDGTGCFMQQVATDSFNFTSAGYFSSQITANASLLEDGTGVQLTASQDYDVSYVAGTVSFENMDQYYRIGQPFRGMIKMQGVNGVLRKHTKVYLNIIYGSVNIWKEYVTDKRGRVSFALQTNHWNNSQVELWVKTNRVDPPYVLGRDNVYYNNDMYTVQPFRSSAKSFLRIQPLPSTLLCGLQYKIQVAYTLKHNELPPNAKSVNFYYIITGKGGIVNYGQTKINTEKRTALSGVVSIHVTFTSDIAPHGRLLGYILLNNGKITADRIDFIVEECFKNKVDLKFSKAEALPGSKIKLLLKAAPNSLCAVRAVDLSVLLLKPEEELTAASVYGLFQYTDRTGYPSEVDEFVMPNPCWNPFVFRLPKVSVINWYPYNSQNIDVFYFFKEVGLKILTNFDVYVKTASNNMAHTFPCPLFENIVKAPVPGPPDTAVTPKSTIRTNFLETFLWDELPIGPSGKKDVVVTLPDSITEWKSMTFCVSGLGFGLSKTASVTTFKPFFVDLTLPYAVVRGESFDLKATVFNYLKQCIVVQVFLEPSPDFGMEQCSECLYNHCVCADESFTFEWNITATTLGLVNFTVTTTVSETCGLTNMSLSEAGLTDALMKPLLVQPEGIPEVQTQSALFCPKGSPIVEMFSLDLPRNVIPGSSRAEVIVLGDIMGSALQNLGDLIQMPYGCGEQNMITFAPIIYVLQYLQKTGQLTAEIRARAIGYLNNGYQRELNYKHSDGSFSAFGESDGDGNTWLTAFVAKCFGQAKQFIFIDDQVISVAVDWLTLHQNMSTGCFENVGRLIHTSLKGGVDDEVSLTAYITAALLELGKKSTDVVVANAVTCLQTALYNVTSVYTKALLAYMFTLLGNEPERTTLLSELDGIAIVEDGQMHWAYSTSPPAASDDWSGPQSADVETTAYVLLAYLSVNNVPSADIGKATQIVMWMTRQQNAYGGYASTQDTVVALQALAKYATLTYTKQEVVTVSVTTTQGFSATFTVDNGNRLLLQQQSLPQIPGVYTVSASGQGCVLVELILRFNVPPPSSVSAFNLSVEATCLVQNPVTVSLAITVMYTGSRNQSNMAIIEVTMLSGYQPANDADIQLLAQPLVKRVDIQTGSLSIYLEEVSQSSQTYSFSVIQEVVVRNIQPASVKVYDYYQPEENAVVDYTAPCS